MGNPILSLALRKYTPPAANSKDRVTPHVGAKAAPATPSRSSRTHAIRIHRISLQPTRLTASSQNLYSGSILLTNRSTSTLHAISMSNKHHNTLSRQSHHPDGRQERYKISHKLHHLIQHPHANGETKTYINITNAFQP
ncbi:hypothetical protein L873DRAFT_1125475 [Choiromyces venosus 120613-1]|uniref:Uncharacterized protein n=1 Tax=Choiromyces venosus 120613-1 TaxID=1336337 RepID=A0A3N4JKQ4_9PEZI|nr:hypothetical protein L873DRAFT_1125475 [Choiromyces venosus 120613-1]